MAFVEDDWLYCGIGSVTICLLMSCCLVRCLNKRHRKRPRFNQINLNRNRTTQQEDIYNISGRVPQQQQGQGQWPPHSTTGQVTLDNLTISNETNKHNDDPPTYEEAMRLAIAASQDPSNNVVPAVVPPSAVPMAPPKPSD